MQTEDQMATWEYELVEPPLESRARELWLQHAAGFILTKDVRCYAMEKMDTALPEESRAAVQKGIDDALYGLMMIIDGVMGELSNANHIVSIDFIVRLAASGDAQDRDGISGIDLRHGDGMCMGYHGWLEGDFGIHPVATLEPEADTDGRASGQDEP